MNKKVMALAVAGALAAPATALAQVQIGGGLHYQYFDWDSGATASKKTDALNSSEPEIYFRGEEKLGGGNSVWFQCSSSFDIVGTGASNASGNAQWCGRNSAFGMRGGFGNVFVGNWDTPQKLITNLARGWWGGTNTLQGGSLVLLGNGTATAGNTGTSFFRRQNRGINYHSANWGGFTLNAMFSSGNEQTALSEGSPFKPRMYSIGGQFQTGPFFAGIGLEQHKDFNITTAVQSQKDDNFNLAVGYTIAGARISALYFDTKYEIGNAAGQDLKKKGYALYVDWRIAGPHSLYFQYAQADDSKGNSTAAVGSFAAPMVGAVANPLSTGATVIGAAYGYSFSKRTQGYVAYNQLENDDGANFTFGTSAGSLGGKQTAIGVGLKHSF
jgi:predicted porin